MTARLRDFRPGDEQAAAYICLKTGDHGQDGEPYYAEDPDALSRIYTAPYFLNEPELAVILEDAIGVCGYALAARDSRRFFSRYDREIRPGLCQRFPSPTGDEANWTQVEAVYHLYHHPDYFCPEPYEQYPSHLHIDLLPRAQGEGYGRQMIEELIGRLERLGSPGVHLGMSDRNRSAFGFYVSLGFRELVRHDGAIYMGMRLPRLVDEPSVSPGYS